MDKGEEKTYWRCRLCGSISPVGSTRCVNSSCGADLFIYGDFINEEELRRGEEERRRQEEARRQDEERKKEEARRQEQQRREEEQRRLQEEEKRRAEELRRQEEEKKKKEEEEKKKKRKRRTAAVLISLAALVIVILIIIFVVVGCDGHGGQDDETTTQETTTQETTTEETTTEETTAETTEETTTQPKDAYVVSALDGTQGVTGENYENLFDGDADTKWCVTTFDDYAYVMWEMSEEISVSKVYFTTAADNSRYPGRSPVTWSLYGLDSPSDLSQPASWHLIDSIEDSYTMYNDKADCEKYIWTLSPQDTGEYKYFLLVIYEVADDGSKMQLADVELVD